MLKLKISGGDGVHVTEFDCKGHQLHEILRMSSLVTWPKNRQGRLTRLELEHLHDTPKYKYGIDGLEGQAGGFTITSPWQLAEDFMQIKLLVIFSLLEPKLLAGPNELKLLKCTPPHNNEIKSNNCAHICHASFCTEGKGLS